MAAFPFVVFDPEKINTVPVHVLKILLKIGNCGSYWGKWRKQATKWRKKPYEMYA